MLNPSSTAPCTTQSRLSSQTLNSKESLMISYREELLAILTSIKLFRMLPTLKKVRMKFTQNKITKILTYRIIFQIYHTVYPSVNFPLEYQCKTRVLKNQRPYSTVVCQTQVVPIIRSHQRSKTQRFQLKWHNTPISLKICL
jgi:hypothetical protein